MNLRDPRLEDLLLSYGQRLKLEIRTHVPATVITFDPATRRAKVSVDVLAVIEDAGQRARPGQATPTTTADPIVLEGVPVQYPSSSQGGTVWPLVAGDRVELHVQDRSIERWLSQAGATGAPAARWTHALADAVAHPTEIHAPGAVDPSATVIDGAALVKVGAGASDFVALAALVLAELQKVKAAFDAHTHTVNTAVTTDPVTGSGTGVGTASAPAPMPAPSSVAATKAQAE